MANNGYKRYLPFVWLVSLWALVPRSPLRYCNNPSIIEVKWPCGTGTQLFHTFSLCLSSIDWGRLLSVRSLLKAMILNLGRLGEPAISGHDDDQNSRVGVPRCAQELTKMRTEMLGTAYTAQHSDCRVLEQLCPGTNRRRWATGKCFKGSLTMAMSELEAALKPMVQQLNNL